MNNYKFGISITEKLWKELEAFSRIDGYILSRKGNPRGIRKRKKPIIYYGDIYSVLTEEQMKKAMDYLEKNNRADRY